MAILEAPARFVLDAHIEGAPRAVAVDEARERHNVGLDHAARDDALGLAFEIKRRAERGRERRVVRHVVRGGLAPATGLVLADQFVVAS